MKFRVARRVSVRRESHAGLLEIDDLKNIEKLLKFGAGGEDDFFCFV